MAFVISPKGKHQMSKTQTNTKPKKLTPQVASLLNYLRTKKTITAVEARAVFQIEALPRRIADLKDAGYDIEKKMKKDAKGKRYARYTFKGLKKDEPVLDVAPVATPEAEAPTLELKVGSRIKITRATTRSHAIGLLGIYYQVGDEGVVTRLLAHSIEVRFDTPRMNRHVVLVHPKELEVIA